MTLRRHTFAAVMLAASIATGALAPAQDPPRDHDITIDDYFSLALLSDIAVSPDGGQVAYVDRRWEPPRETRNADLWVVPAAGGTPRRLTFEFGDETSPQWSADGRSLYCLASRKRDDGKFPPYNDKNQVWRLTVDSGAEIPVTLVEAGVDAFEVSKDGALIYYTVSKDAREDSWKPLQEKFGSLNYGEGTRKVSELWKLDLATWRTERLLEPGRYIHEFTVSPDGRRAAMITTDDDKLISLEGFSRVDVHDLASGKTTALSDDLWRKQAPSPFGWLTSLAWSRDGRRLAFVVAFDGYPAVVHIAQWGPDQGDPQIWRLSRQDELHVEESRLRWAGDRDLLFVGHSQARQRVYRVRNIASGMQGPTEEVTPGDVVVYAFDVSRNGTTALVKSEPTNLNDVFLADPGSLRRLTDVNTQARTWKLPQISLVQWKAPDGKKVEGVLELPPGHKEGERLPLLLDIHGGPTAAASFDLSIDPYGGGLFAARGYARLSPNYRGSLGYGDDFLRDLVGHENEIEVKDLLAGVDALIAQGIADPDRLAVAGWSNGGFLTAAVITADQRFKAASCGAGVVDQFLQWGSEDTPGHVINFMGGNLPWAAPGVYQKSSPAYAFGRVKTPTLIHVGENDERVPAAHARALHRALKRYLGVPTQLVVYPAEGHSLTKLENRRAKMEWDAAWLDRYVLGKGVPADD